MESLLRWGIQNSASANESDSRNVAPRQDLNPEIIDAILGKSDAEQMKEDLAVALDENRMEDERVDGLDHLEMLIESIDNANDLAKLKMWEPLHNLVTSDSSPEPVILQTLWVIGTALQNNPSAQDSYMALNPLSTLTSFISPNANVSPQLRSKVIYVLSGLLKHNSLAVSKFDDQDVDGWSKLRQGLQDPDIAVRRKIAFLLNSLLLPSAPASTDENEPTNLHIPNTQTERRPEQPIHANSHAAQLRNPNRAETSPIAKAAIEKHGIISLLVQGLTNPLPYGVDGDVLEPDLDFEEKGVGLLRTYLVDCHGQLSAQESESVKDWIRKEQSNESGAEQSLAERWGLSIGELKGLVGKIEG